MSVPSMFSGLEVRSLVTAEAMLELWLEPVEHGSPAPGELIVRMEGAPVNPSDLGLLLGPADPRKLEARVEGKRKILTAPIPAARFAGMAGRVGQPLPVGLEGMGVVVGAGEGAEHLMDRTVAMMGAGSYAEYRRIDMSACLLLPDGTSPSSGAGALINPMTALSLVETMRREGHKALVHSAAASNLGQMLNRICIADGIGLVNIVRSPAQAQLLFDIGARHVCDTSVPTFATDLADAIAASGATIAFDAIGGGELAEQILAAMEMALSRNAATYSRYGSSVHKQVYIYGGLDVGPTLIRRGYGMSWGVGGWLLMPFLERIGTQSTQALKDRVVRELDTTFASHYAHSVSLEEFFCRETLTAMSARGTGSKFLVKSAAAS